MMRCFWPLNPVGQFHLPCAKPGVYDADYMTHTVDPRDWEKGIAQGKLWLCTEHWQRLRLGRSMRD